MNAYESIYTIVYYVKETLCDIKPITRRWLCIRLNVFPIRLFIQIKMIYTSSRFSRSVPYMFSISPCFSRFSNLCIKTLIRNAESILNSMRFYT